MWACCCYSIFLLECLHVHLLLIAHIKFNLMINYVCSYLVLLCRTLWITVSSTSSPIQPLCLLKENIIMCRLILILQMLLTFHWLVHRMQVMFPHLWVLLDVNLIITSISTMLLIWLSKIWSFKGVVVCYPNWLEQHTLPVTNIFSGLVYSFIVAIMWKQ